MNILDEMAQDWVKRLCAVQLDYTKRLDLLAVEYNRMSIADREAVKTAVGDKGIVVALANLPSTKSSIALNVGGSPSEQTVRQLTKQLPLEALVDLMGLFGLAIYEAHAPSKEHVVTFVSDKVTIAVHLTDNLKRQTEEIILNAAKKGQC